MHSIVTVTTPASSYDLTTADAVKAELGITGTAEDAQLAAWIPQASGAIAAYCGRVLALETVSETFRLRAPGECRIRPVPALLLTRFPVAVVDSVTVDGVALSGSEYEADPESGQLFRLSADAPIEWYGSKITVAYSGGYDLLPALPQPIERACLNLVKAYRAAATRDPLIRSESVDGVLSTTYWVGGTPGTSGGLPPDVAELLNPYRIPLLF